MDVSEIVLNNWLLNPTGGCRSFVEADLVQEHFNYWIKVHNTFALLLRQCDTPTFDRITTMLVGATRHGDGWQQSHLVCKFYASSHLKLMLPWVLDRVLSMVVQILLTT
jgi:hypothetical protein